MRTRIALFAALLVLVAVGVSWRSSVLELREANDLAAKYQAELAEALDSGEMLADENIALHARVEVLVSEVEAVNKDNAGLREQIKRLSTTARPQGQTSPDVSRSGGKAWTRERVAATLRAAAASYGLSATETTWIVEVGCRVAYRESSYRPDARNGQHLGLMQFNAAWGTAEQRLDPVWSLNRFVKVYADGGESAVKKHWAATY
jgi:hypothetical protein